MILTFLTFVKTNEDDTINKNQGIKGNLHNQEVDLPHKKVDLHKIADSHEVTRPCLQPPTYLLHNGGGRNFISRNDKPQETHA